MEEDHQHKQIINNILACVENFEFIAPKLLVISIFVLFFSSQYSLVLQYYLVLQYFFFCRRTYNSFSSLMF